MMKWGEGETIIRSINNKSNQEETRRKKQVDIAGTQKIEEGGNACQEKNNYIIQYNKTIL